MKQPRTGHPGILPARSLMIMIFFAVGFSGVEAQLNLNGGASYAEALGGQWGVEGRLGFYPPGLPFDFFGGAEYFFADCEEECGLWGGRVGAILHSPTPGFQPYLTGAFVQRRWTLGDEQLDRRGMSAGAGIRVGLGKLRIQGEVTREFLGGDLDQWVIRLGTG